MEPKESPVHQVDSDNSPTYAEIVGNKSPLRNSWWLQYQSEEEEAALTLAIQKSLEEEKQVRRNCSIFFRLSAELVTHISSYYDTVTKKVKQSDVVSNVYFHLNPNCVTVRHQFFIPGLIKVPDDVIPYLDQEHKDVLKQITGLHVP